MSIVLRIEHSVTKNGVFHDNKYGVYSSDSNDIFREIRITHKRFPNPREDKNLKGIKKNQFCAFKSIEQIQQWFTKEQLSYLYWLGFRILMIDVNYVKVGEYQNLFKKEYVKSVKDVSELFI